MRILIVMVTYWPFENPQTFRWKALAEGMVKEGHDVWVVTSGGGGLKKEETINGVRVIRTGKAGPGVHLREKEKNKPVGERSWLFRLLSKLQRRTWKRIWWPDSAVWWYFSGLRAARSIVKAGGIQRVYTTSLPFTAHWIGVRLKREFPELCWVADHGDPFSIRDVLPQNNHRLYHRLNRRAERLVLRQADVNVATTRSLQALYREWAPAARVEYMPHFLPGLDWPDPSALRDATVLNIGYFGKAAHAGRSLEPMLRMLAAWNRQPENGRMELEVWSTGGRLEEGGRGVRFCRWHAPIPKAEVPAAIMQMDVLLSLGYDTPWMMPMKIMEYLESSLPIIHASFCEGDPVQEAFGATEGIYILECWRSGYPERELPGLRDWLAKVVGERFERWEVRREYALERIVAMYLE